MQMVNGLPVVNGMQVVNGVQVFNEVQVFNGMPVVNRVVVRGVSKVVVGFIHKFNDLCLWIAGFD